MKGWVLCALAIAACLPAPAVAQDATRIPDPAAVPREVGKERQAREAQRVMNEYGACVVKTARRRAEAAVREFPGTNRAGETMLDLATSDCLMHGELRFKPRLLRATLFEALYEADFKVRPADISAVSQIDYFVGAADPSDEKVREQVALRQFADCVARANPKGARDLILSKVGEKPEQVAFNELMPVFGQCLRQGIELEFSRPVLRGLVAETMYRLSQAAAQSASLSR